jgi:hypothetical protein
MDDTDLYRERILRHAGPVITGRFAGYRTSYTREVKVGGPLLVAVFLAARVAQAIGTMMLAVLRAQPASGRRSFKELRKKPEYLVTPLRLRDSIGQVYEVELHGQLPQSALHRGDAVQVTTRAQQDPKQAVKVVRLVNLTTLQPYTPRIPTMWSHLGPALLVQAVLGVLVLGVLAVSLLR